MITQDGTVEAKFPGMSELVPLEEPVNEHQFPYPSRKGHYNGGGRKTNTGRLAAVEKQKRAFELRKAGLSYAQIAEAAGYASPQAACKAVLTLMRKIPAEERDDLRRLQTERLNHLLAILWPSVVAGDLRSIDTYLRVQDKLDRLLGTDAPQKIQVEAGVVVVEGDREEYIQRLKVMAGLELPEDVLEVESWEEDDVVEGVVDEQEVVEDA